MTWLKRLFVWGYGRDVRTWWAHGLIAVALEAYTRTPGVGIAAYWVGESRSLIEKLVANQPIRRVDTMLDALMPLWLGAAFWAFYLGYWYLGIPFVGMAVVSTWYVWRRNRSEDPALGQGLPDSGK
jgi:hypothetical protein